MHIAQHNTLSLYLTKDLPCHSSVNHFTIGNIIFQTQHIPWYPTSVPSYVKMMARTFKEASRETLCQAQDSCNSQNFDIQNVSQLTI